MDLELEVERKRFGPLSADTVLRDSNTGHLVVQKLLEITDPRPSRELDHVFSLGLRPTDGGFAD